MLANPPYGKSWKSDLERMSGNGGKKDVKDPRFVIEHDGDPEYSLITRSSDGQMLFLANMLSKMKHDTPLGSRIAEIHNGSSLFTGDAGQGESNIRRWVIENDWLEAIVALPLNMFYNTGIATYVWVLTNRKAASRQGKVQLIDATTWFRPLRKNMGKKNCELAVEDIQRICDTFLAFEETPQSKIFPNAAFGYWKVKIERPLRLHSQLTRPRIEPLRYASGDEDILEAIDMDSYRAEKKATMAIALPDADAEIEPVPTSGGGRKPEPEMDRLSNIVNEFNQRYAGDYKDPTRTMERIKGEIPEKVSADPAYQNARKNSDRQNAKIEHDKALKRVLTAMFKDDAQLFKQFQDNESFRGWLTDTIFGITYKP